MASDHPLDTFLTGSYGPDTLTYMSIITLQVYTVWTELIFAGTFEAAGQVTAGAGALAGVGTGLAATYEYVDEFFDAFNPSGDDDGNTLQQQLFSDGQLFGHDGPVDAILSAFGIDKRDGKKKGDWQKAEDHRIFLRFNTTNEEALQYAGGLKVMSTTKHGESGAIFSHNKKQVRGHFHDFPLVQEGGVMEGEFSVHGWELSEPLYGTWLSVSKSEATTPEMFDDGLDYLHKMLRHAAKHANITFPDDTDAILVEIPPGVSIPPPTPTKSHKPHPCAAEMPTVA